MLASLWFLKTALRLGKHSPRRAVTSQRWWNCYCQKPVLVIQHPGPLLHMGVQVTSWKEDKGRSAPHSALNCLGKFHGVWQVALGTLTFCSSLTASKPYFQNTSLQTWVSLQGSHGLAEFKGNGGTILWVSLTQGFALCLEHALPGRRRGRQTNPQPLSRRSSGWVSQRSVSLKEKSFSLSLLLSFSPNWWDCNDRLHSV